jgi:Tfp pilus assembly protein FimT
MPGKTQTTILEILLVIAVAMLIIVMGNKFFSQHNSRKAASE